MHGLNGLEIFLGYPCNQKCNFCFQKDLRFKESKFLDYDVVIDIIDKGFLEGKNSIIFSGGEATMDKNLLSYIKYCKNKGFLDIRVHTNGLLFSNNEKLLDYYNSGMNGVIISIHGFGKIHDYLVGLDGAFEKLKKTFLNIGYLISKDKNFVLDTNTVLTKYNYKTIHILTKFLSYFPITRIQVVQLYSLYLFSLGEKKSLYISYEEFYPFIGKIIESNKSVTFENFPFCKFDNKYIDNIIKRKKYDNDAYGNMGEGFEESDCKFLDTCYSCKYREDCSGIPKDYLSVYQNEKFIAYN